MARAIQEWETRFSPTANGGGGETKLKAKQQKLFEAWDFIHPGALKREGEATIQRRKEMKANYEQARKVYGLVEEVKETEVIKAAAPTLMYGRHGGVVETPPKTKATETGFYSGFYSGPSAGGTKPAAAPAPDGVDVVEQVASCSASGGDVLKLVPDELKPWMAAAESRRNVETEKRYAERYRKIKFFERQKVTRSSLVRVVMYFL